MAIVGYTRASTQDQNLHSQVDALTAAGASQIFTDEITGKDAARPGLVECLKYLRDNEGDVLLVCSTDRLGRSMTDLVSIVGELRRRGIQFRSLTEPFDTTAAGGEMFFHICAAFAQMNGRMLSERTTVGLAAAKARGRSGGRPTVMTPERVEIAMRMREEKATWDTIATTLQVGSASIRRALSTPRAPSALSSEEPVSSHHL